jgi:hypothetical protein
MPVTINGFGTTYYGERDYTENGSFITTEWITAGYIPILPLKSIRVARSQQNVAIFVYTSEGYYLLEKVPLCWPQVLSTYGFLLLGVLWLAAIVTILKVAPINWDRFGVPIIFLSLFGAAIPFFILLWLRARRQKGITRKPTRLPPPLPE